jgi:hypothetical protein
MSPEVIGKAAGLRTAEIQFPVEDSTKLAEVRQGSVVDYQTSQAGGMLSKAEDVVIYQAKSFGTYRVVSSSAI